MDNPAQSSHFSEMSLPVRRPNDLAPLLRNALFPMMPSAPEVEPNSNSSRNGRANQMRAPDPRVTRMSDCDTRRTLSDLVSCAGRECRTQHTNNSYQPTCVSMIKESTAAVMSKGTKIAVQQQQIGSFSSHETSTNLIHNIDCEGDYRETRKKLVSQKVITETPTSTKPRLTLSAFRRPEQTVRITDSDPKRILSEEYKLYSSECRILGHGGAATVRLAVRRVDGAKVAVKSIQKHDALRSRRLRRGNRRYLDEWQILKSLGGHPQIVSLLDLFETDEEIQLVMEYCRGGELFDAILRKSDGTQCRRGTYTEVQAASITSQMLSALKDLHSRGIVHRDVKPENILLVNDDEAEIRIKLSDFGLARVLTEHTEDCDSSGSDGEASPLTPPSRSRAYSCVGTDYYAAPEVSAGVGYDTAVDIYSLGVSLYVLLCGAPPSYSGDTNPDVEEDDVSDVIFPSHHWKDVSEKAKRLVRKMLHPDPAKRTTVAEALKDEWVVENTWKEALEEKQCSAPPALNASIPHVDLKLVRTRLYRNIEPISGQKIEASSKSRSKKRCKLQQHPGASISSLSIMADLHRVVASVATSASAAVACIVLDGFEEDIRVVSSERDVAKKDGKDAREFSSPMTALSV